MTAPTLVQQLAQFAADCTYDKLPRDVAESVKDRILDTLGVSLGAWHLQMQQDVLKLIVAQGGAEEAVGVGMSTPLPAEQAAFASGMFAHAQDFDDTHLPSIIHPSAPIASTVLTAGQLAQASGKDVITAAAVAYEVAIRIANAAYDKEINNSVFFEKGLHGASICGALGAATAAAKLLGANADQIAHAIGICCSMAAGLIEANRTGGTVKQIHGGWACHAGVWAAKLAMAGVTGPPTVLEGRFGFFYALCDNRYDPAAVTDRLGTHWETPGIFYKPYPANHFTHAGIDAALALKAEHGPFNPDDIEAIELGVAGATLRTIAEPPEVKANPPTGYAARFSGPFTVVSALLGGSGLGVHLADFTDENAFDPVRRALAAKVKCYADPECDAIFPYHFPAVLRIKLKGGQVLEKKVLANRGSPDWPLTREELRQKFLLTAAVALPPAQAEQVADLCVRLDELDSLQPLVAAWAVAD